MKSFIYKAFQVSERGYIFSRYTPEENVVLSVLKFILYLFLLWPFQLVIHLPMLIFKGGLIFCELLLRGVAWIVALPFYLIGKKGLPKF